MFENSQERQEIILEGGCHHPFWFAKLPQYSKILKYSFLHPVYLPLSTWNSNVS